MSTYGWARRRAMLWISVVFCMFVIGYVIIAELTSSVAETAVIMAFLCLSSMVGSYVFGATWQDVNHMRMQK